MQANHFRVFFSLFIVLILDAMGFGLAFPIVGPLLLDPQAHLLSPHAPLLEVSFFYGLINAALFLSLLIGAPFFGDLSDKLGRKKVIILCLILIAVGYLISILGIHQHNLLLFIFGRCIDGFCAGSESIAQAAIIDISTPERKTINLGLISVAGSLGFVIGPLLGGVFSDPSIVHWFYYDTPFIIASLLSLLNAILLFFSFRETRPLNKTVSVQLWRGLQSFAAAFREKSLRQLSLIFLSFQIAWAIYFQIVSLLFAEKYHYSPKMIGFFYAYLGGIIAISLLFFVRFGLRFFKERQLLFITLLMAIIGTAFGLFIQKAWVPWVSSIFIATGMGIAYTCVLSFYSSAVSSNRQGWVMGISNAVVAFSWGCGSFFVGMFPINLVKILLLFICVLLCFSLLFLKRLPQTFINLNNDSL